MGILTKFWVLLLIKPIFNVINPFLGVIGHFWSLNSWRKLEMDNQLHHYLSKAILRQKGQLLRAIQSRDAEAKLSLSQFEAGKLLRRRCCRTISESSGHPFQVP